MGVRARRLLPAVLTALILGAGGAAHAAVPATRTISGTISTADGGDIETPVLVSLYSWFPAGDSSYPTRQAAVLIPAGEDLHYSLEVPTNGYYAMRAQPTGGSAKYLTTWYGSGRDIASNYGDPGVIFFPDDASPSRTDIDISVRRAATLTGTVRGANGQPLEGARLSARQWSEATPAQLAAIPGGGSALSDADGHYAMPVEPGAKVSLAVADRAGYAPWSVGTEAPQSAITVTGTTTRDVGLTQDWSDAPGAAIQREEYCLQRATGGTAQLPGRQVQVFGDGVISRDDHDIASDPFSDDAAGAALVPYWNGSALSVTWGVSGSSLCAVWRSTTLGIAFQAILTDDGEVAYNYGVVPTNWSTREARAGSNDGAGGIEDLGAGPSLLTGSLGSAVPGRYRFAFEGFLHRLVAGDTRPSVRSVPIVGVPVTADPGTWSTPDGGPAGLRYRYAWLRDGEPIPAAAGVAYVPTRADAGHRLAVRVTALADGYDESFDEDSAGVRVGRASLRPRIEGRHRVRAGTRARVRVLLDPTPCRATTTGALQILVDGRRVVVVPNGRECTWFRLPRLRPGTHRLEAIFSGDEGAQAATSRVFRLRVLGRR